MECNLPELLARDLELSKSVFTSRHMTADAPSLSLTAGDRGRHQSMRLRPTSHHPHLLNRVRSDGAVGSLSPEPQGYSTSWLDQSEARPEASCPDGHAEAKQQALPKEGLDFSDDTSHSSDFDVEPPSIRYREQSVTTVATSVTSRRGSSAMPQLPLSPTEVNEIRMYFRDEHSTKTPFQRPHTASGSPSKDERPMSPTEMPAVAIPRRRSSLNRRVPEMEQPQSPRSSLATLPNDVSLFAFSVASPPSSMEMTRSPAPMDERTAPDVAILRKPVPRRNPEPAPEENRGRQAAPSTTYTRVAEEEDYRSIHHHAGGAHDVPDIPVPSLNHVQTWLDSSVDVAYQPPRPTRDRMVAAAVPLPREMIDNLTVSVASFPEAMLVTSNLAIETIRAYSRKMRRQAAAPDDDDGSVFAPSDAASSVRRRWKFPRLLSSRAAPPPHPRLPPLRTVSPCPSSASLARDAAAGPESRHIMAVFPAGSPYLCNALYAHLVAYNYVSSLCAPAPPRPTPPPPASPTPSASSSSSAPRRPRPDDAGRRIPSKAASLLGLSPAAPQATAVKSPLHGGFPSARTAELEAALRQLQAGLATCVGRLVATLRLTGGHHTAAAADDDVGVDPLFLRALCEIVRCAEERY